MGLKRMKVALVHDWLNGMRGGEKVLESLCEIFPEADLYALLHRPGSVSGAIEKHPIRTSFLQRLPLAQTHYRYFLPLMPTAIERLRLEDYDLVVSSSHCVAKGVSIEPVRGSRSKAAHVCYCHTPMRYLYDQFESYFVNGRSSLGFAARTAMRCVRPYLRRWDLKSSRNVDLFLANSEHVRSRIQAVYQRDAKVLYPPVDTELFTPAPEGRGWGTGAEPYYLVVSSLVPYKRVDLAIEACSRLSLPLKVAGSGPAEESLKGWASGKNVEFLGWVSPEGLRDLYRGCKALLYPQEEDFGISAVEAMACGRPVIALSRGGALETVSEGESGLFFREQTAQSLSDVLRRFQGVRWESQRIRARALCFGRKRFKDCFLAFLDEMLYNQAPALAK